MQKLLYALLAAGTLVAPTAQAIEPASEPAMMLYYSVPFGGARRHEAPPVFGFRMQMTSTQSDQLFELGNSAERNAMMDVRYTNQGMQGFYVNGINTLVEKNVINAATGEAETATGIDWGLVAIGVIGVVALTQNKDCKEQVVTYAGYTPVLGISVSSCGGEL